jgi:hypothetical protein
VPAALLERVTHKTTFGKDRSGEVNQGPLFFGLSKGISINNRSVLMAVHPIEERYGTTEMRAVWSEKYRFACVVATEGAIKKTLLAVTKIDRSAFRTSKN